MLLTVNVSLLYQKTFYEICLVDPMPSCYLNPPSSGEVMQLPNSSESPVVSCCDSQEIIHKVEAQRFDPSVRMS